MNELIGSAAVPAVQIARRLLGETLVAVAVVGSSVVARVLPASLASLALREVAAVREVLTLRVEPKVPAPGVEVVVPGLPLVSRSEGASSTQTTSPRRSSASVERRDFLG